MSRKKMKKQFLEKMYRIASKVFFYTYRKNCSRKKTKDSNYRINVL